jgi:hypothetical protein
MRQPLLLFCRQQATVDFLQFTGIKTAWQASR